MQLVQAEVTCFLFVNQNTRTGQSQSNRTYSQCPMGKVSLKVTQSVLLPNLSGLMMMHWRYRSGTVKSGASQMCLHFPCQCGQVMD